jgi:hypothetical protein
MEKRCVFYEVGTEFLDIIGRVPSSIDVTPCSSLLFDLKMEALRYSEMAANFYQTTRRYIPEDSERCVNVKCNIAIMMSS